MTADPRSLAEEQFCYLTTTGHVTDRPHEIEIWFAVEDLTLYLLSGARDRSDWVRNLRRNSKVTVRIDGELLDGRARVVEDDKEEPAPAGSSSINTSASWEASPIGNAPPCRSPWISPSDDRRPGRETPAPLRNRASACGSEAPGR